MDSTSIDAQLRCVQREIEMRERVYPPRVADGKMNKFQADHELTAMRAVLATLKKVALNAPPKISRGR